jgi:hypothetical protein
MKKIKFSIFVAIATIGFTFANHVGAFSPKSLAPAAVDCYTSNLKAASGANYSLILNQSCDAAVTDLTGQCLIFGPRTPIDPAECGAPGNYFCCAKIVNNTSCAVPIKPEGLTISGYSVTQVYCKNF